MGRSLKLKLINIINVFVNCKLIRRRGRNIPCPIGSIACIQSALLIYNWVGCIGRLGNCSINTLDRAIERE